MLCSSARRTVLTCNGILPALPADTTVEIEQDLYGASGSRLLARLRRLDADVPSVLVIGHNPGMHSLASMLTGAGDPELRGRLATAFPTGALATLSFDGSWADLAPGAATWRPSWSPASCADPKDPERAGPRGRLSGRSTVCVWVVLDQAAVRGAQLGLDDDGRRSDVERRADRPHRALPDGAQEVGLGLDRRRPR